jgi:hypothetical protein
MSAVASWPRRSGSTGTATVRYASTTSTSQPLAARPRGRTSRATAARASSTRPEGRPDPAGGASGNASISDSATNSGGTRLASTLPLASASAVPEPMAATLQRPKARASSHSARSATKRARAPLGDVTTTQS